MDLFIVTGGSKGLGEQICLEALNQGHQVINFSRSRPAIKAVNFKSISVDLSKGLVSVGKIQKALEKVNITGFKRVHLINNAGLINPVGPLAEMVLKDINTHLQTNFVAPLLLSQICAEISREFKKNLTIFNIGSGASFRPIAGWSMYCASKAGLKMFTEATAMDLGLAKNKKIQIYHFSPGVLDTQMQQQIRGFKKKDFPNVADFKKLKSDQMLRSPQQVAEKIVSFCLKPQSFGVTSNLISIQDLESKGRPSE